MANKLSRAIGNVKTALDALVASGDLKAVKRTVINPLMAMQLPVLGVKMVRYRRQGSIWIAELLLTLVTKAGEAADDERNLDLAALVDETIEALVAAGTAQAAIDAPTWEPWEWREREAGPLLPIGSLGNLTMRVEAPLAL